VDFGRKEKVNFMVYIQNSPQLSFLLPRIIP